jgi:3-carboxy-cis,cis-muconate cycloisomerase
MSPSSSTSDVDPFAFLVARGPVVEVTSAAAWIQALLDAEIALARAHAAVGAISDDWADAVAAVATVDRIDVEALLAETGAGGNAVIPLVAALRDAVGADAASAVHRGATSQDIVDSASMVVVGRASALVADDLDRAALTASALGDRHGTTPVVGRTLLQHAVPTTLATTTERWRDGLTTAAAELRRVAAALPVQLGGPVGDPASFDGKWPELVARMAGHLGLAVPPRPWHTQRMPVTAIAGAWGSAAAAVATVALDVVLLAQQEVGLLAERAEGAGGSSSMPHKHNPIAAVSARAAALQAPGLVATLLHCAGGHELERAAGAWHAEWPALRSLLRATGAAASWLNASLDRLVVVAAEARP